MSRANSILLVSCKSKSGAEKYYLPAIAAAGWEGAVTLLTPGDPLPDLDTAAGLLLTGGHDIHPCHWDAAEAVHARAEVDSVRDTLEVPLVRAVWERNLPILGTCRGEQILNVALGAASSRTSRTTSAARPPGTSMGTQTTRTCTTGCSWPRGPACGPSWARMSSW